MKVISVFNSVGDEIRIGPDMLEFYASIGWHPATKKQGKKLAVKSEESE